MGMKNKKQKTIFEICLDPLCSENRYKNNKYNYMGSKKKIKLLINQQLNLKKQIISLKVKNKYFFELEGNEIISLATRFLWEIFSTRSGLTPAEQIYKFFYILEIRQKPPSRNLLKKLRQKTTKSASKYIISLQTD